MKQITLQAIPNQKAIVTLDGNRFEIELKFTGEIMTYGLIKNGLTVIENGARLVNGVPLLPYDYLVDGNFILKIPDDELANYESFQVTQYLLYASQEELDSL